MIKKKSKKQKAQKSVSSKKKLKFENYKNCLEVNQLKNKINHLKKLRLMWVVLEKSKKKIIKSNTLISKSQQRFRSETNNVFPNKSTRFHWVLAMIKD